MPTRPNPYRQDLDRNAANYAPLTPISLVRWAADVFPDRCAAIHGEQRYTWAQMQDRASRLASVLATRDIGSGDTVSALLPNTPPMLDAHFGVPMTGAVLNTINTRLDASTVAFQLRHSAAKVLMVDREFAPVASEALAILSAAGQSRPFVVGVDDPVYRGPGERIGDIEYETWLASGDPSYDGNLPDDEWDAIGLNYTSGTTGDPKGVVVHHRGAYLNAVGNVLAWALPRHPVYLWTLPMFHCNGWCFPWTIPAVAGTNVCLRRVEAKAILDLVREHRVTHYCGAPIVHGTLIDAPAEWKKGIDWPVRAMVAGAAPPAAMIEGMERMGWEVTHVYGLTEVYGPASVCVKHDAWNELDLAGRVARNARQGVRYQVQEGLTVVDPNTMQPVPRDAETMGEVVFRGNIVMKGYLKNEKATADAFAGGWFHTGDLGVVYPDGYVKLKDRAKDVIISGGENISSIEVEDALYKHPAVLACAVVAKPDERWGETPLAFVELRAERVPGTPEESKALADELIAHCREHLARYKVPREVRFGTVPKTSTGKIQKHVLRARAKSASAIG
ncbi:MAG: acyl-CoA synthetase [Burkholderiaceae bacterium]|nr:acyl-CoA synthetase [Burkholderiaceae bacterium]